MKLSAPNTPGLDDQKAETVRRVHSQKITELQLLPFAGAVLLQDVVLKNSTVTPIAHGLRKPTTMIIVSPVRNSTGTAGIIQDFGAQGPTGPLDPNQYISLRAIGYGSDITVDIVVL